MPVLTNARHERFAQELARGRSSTDAYRLSGYTGEGASAWSMASRLARKVEVSARVRELQGDGAERAALTEEWVLSRLMANAERAMEAEQIYDDKGQPTGEYRYDGAVANRALELLGKRLGIFIDRSEVTQTVRDISDEPVTADEWAERHVTAH